MLRRFCILVLAAVMLAGCSGRQSRQQSPQPRPVRKYDLTESARAWADSVCSSLSLRQRVAQLFIPAVYASPDGWTDVLVRQYADSCVGGIMFLKGDSEGARILADSMMSASQVPPFIAIDAEWGLAMRLTDAPEFPKNANISQEATDRIMFDYGSELARECRLLGINMVLGPVLDISVPGSFMSRRSLGDDPHRVADLSLAYAHGLEAGNVISVAKHFPGHGSVSADSHKETGVIERSLHEMDSLDLYPFRKWVEQRLTAIMVGHLAVPSIDSSMKPAAVSSIVIRDLLRTDMQFSGLVLTDALNMKGASGYTSVDAVKAGTDIVLAPNRTFDEIENVVRAVMNGEVTETEINEHVRRILFYKYLLAVGSDSPSRHPFTELASSRADSIATVLSTP